MALTKVRTQRILKHGSAWYLKNVEELTAGAWTIYSLADLSADAPKYEPLDYVEVTNVDTSSAVRLVLDHGDSLLVPPSAIRTLDNHPFRTLQIHNEGASTIAAGKVSVLARRAPITVDKYIREFRL